MFGVLVIPSSAKNWYYIDGSRKDLRMNWSSTSSKKVVMDRFYNTQSKK